MSWTYGAEFELVDWDRRRQPCSWPLDDDWTMVNSNGIAVNPPPAHVYHLGGEVQSHPSGSPGGVAEQLADFMRIWPEAQVNYRTNLHCHIRVPGLREDLGSLKRVQAYCQEWLPTVLPVIEPIPEPTREDYPEPDEMRGARKRFARRHVSHQKVMGADAFARQVAATTPTEFFEAEALHPPSGKIYWATKPRCAVNLRQLLQTDTIEFRHFPGTNDPAEVLSALIWCREFLILALNGDTSVNPLNAIWLTRDWSSWPQFRPYVHWMECCYAETSAHYVGAAAARAAVETILGYDGGRS